MAMIQVDITNIRTLFATAASNGVAKPMLRVHAVTISTAPPTGRNAGYLYIKDINNECGM